MTETVTRLRATVTKDRYGGGEKTWDDPERLTIPDCLIAPRVDTEDTTTGREGRVIGWTIYAPDGADVTAVDRVEVRSITYDVDGEPEDWSGGWDWNPGIVIQTRSARG